MFKKLVLICLIIAFSACSTAYGQEHSAPQSKLERCEIDRTTTGIGITPSEYMDIASSVCKDGYQVFINLIHDNFLRYVIHGICDLRYSVIVDRNEIDFEGKYGNEEEWEDRYNSVSCIYSERRD